MTFDENLKVLLEVLMMHLNSTKFIEKSDGGGSKFYKLGVG